MAHDMENKIREFISLRFMRGKGTVSDSESLFSSGIVDSLKLMELIAFVEKEYGISVNMNEVTVNNFDSINSICGLIKSKK
ncbi:MAG: acyl carrier protein [Candidatus Omnitrophica bacterium]|nr:acyl carrier protein [Candidatus Omnitrophota bacterium]